MQKPKGWSTRHHKINNLQCQGLMQLGWESGLWKGDQKQVISSWLSIPTITSKCPSTVRLKVSLEIASGFCFISHKECLDYVIKDKCFLNELFLPNHKSVCDVASCKIRLFPGTAFHELVLACLGQDIQPQNRASYLPRSLINPCPDKPLKLIVYMKSDWDFLAN